MSRMFAYSAIPFLVEAIFYYFILTTAFSQSKDGNTIACFVYFSANYNQETPKSIINSYLAKRLFLLHPNWIIIISFQFSFSQSNCLTFAAVLAALVTVVVCLPVGEKTRRQVSSASSVPTSTPCSLSFFRYLYNLPGEKIRPPVPAGTVLFNKVVPPEEGFDVGSSQLQPSYQRPTTFNEPSTAPIQPQASFQQPSYRPPPPSTPSVYQPTYQPPQQPSYRAPPSSPPTFQHSEGSRIDAPEPIKPESTNDNKVGYLPPPPDSGYLPPPSDTNKLEDGEEGSAISPVTASPPPSSEYPALESKYNPAYSVPQHNHNDGSKCTCEDKTTPNDAYPGAGSESKFAPSVVAAASENRIDYTFSTPPSPPAPAPSQYTSAASSTRFVNAYPGPSPFVPQFNAVPQTPFASTAFRQVTSPSPFVTSDATPSYSTVSGYQYPKPSAPSYPSYPSVAASEQVGSYSYPKPNIPFPPPQVSSNRFVSENDQTNDNLIVLKV